ncbi:hypothetical protein JRQ81_007913 [Phrynocephalus forsythii]|uniref:RRM domain-containing protein n=1 Tax=Phrynocephalus forsythii TaxID=171643 RepID=A0A9Q0XCD5_9SAUR|nr:hypothetical protein JRQ81_007913 [Phrynocephalus forsythii]
METEGGLFGRKRAAPKGKDGVAPAVAPRRKEVPRIAHDSEKESVTVFVSNLSYSLPEPEATLKALFAECGEVAQARPIFNNKGLFRGYAYVEFTDEKAALQALSLDRKNVEGRLMYVSPCVDKTKNPDFKVFKYSTALEKHKLFVSGLPRSYTKEALEELCRAHGNVREVRLVSNRAGRSKGLAYVEFENEAQASQAVLKMDGLTVDGHTIKVAISNPPSRKLPEKLGAAGRTSQAPAPRQVYGARGKGRTQLAMIPRALQRQSNPATKVENGTIPNAAPPPPPPPLPPRSPRSSPTQTLQGCFSTSDVASATTDGEVQEGGCCW